MKGITTDDRYDVLVALFMTIVCTVAVIFIMFYLYILINYPPSDVIISSLLVGISVISTVLIIWFMWEIWFG